MLALDTKARLADRLGRAFAGLMRGVLVAGTALLPKNGREHVRRVAITEVATALQDVEVFGQTLRLEWGALITGQPLRWLEPETIEWLETHVRDGDVLWDIGANVGIYALWCAKRHPACRVIAFEPNALTYPVLVRHVIGNDLTDRVSALPLALSEGRFRLEAFSVCTMFPGMAANQLEIPQAPRLSDRKAAATYAALVASPDDLVGSSVLPPPDHLKLDVDGIEPIILAGAEAVLRRVRSVLVEVEDWHVRHHPEGAEGISRPLRDAGLVEDVAFRGRGSGRNRLFVRPSG